MGIFPRGDSSEGVGDLSGNVWEWTSSLYRPYPYEPDDGREDPLGGDDSRRVLRGGSWSSYRDGARAASRSHYLPGDRGYLIGVRLVRLPPIFM